MSLKKELQDLLRAIRNVDFSRSKSDILKKMSKEAAPRKKSDAAHSFGSNRDNITEDKRPVEKPDPYQAEVDKINQRIKQAKALTPQDMRNIEKTLAQQDIQKDIYRSRMNMASDEAREKQRAKEDKEERRRKFKEEFTRDNDRDHER